MAVEVHEADRPTTSTQVWTTRPIPRRRGLNEHTTTVLGLRVEVREERRYVSWTTGGFLLDVQVRAYELLWDRLPTHVEDAKAAAIRAARRLHAVGVRPTRTDPLEEPLSS
jgi:hypothetical protein